ncbi:MAG TPA: asparaginase domain-containing protein [Candidatus Paceibacterota bacterium]|nr:asparaginase domain-containing protein [Candidatus Paceibacterota bacterium]
MNGQVSQPLNFSENTLAKGRVLVLAVGGAGMPRKNQNINDNLKEALSMVPYLSDAAARIDYLSLAQKDSADLTTLEIATIGNTIQRYQNQYDGFVVIAGTDTMPYTASATAYALRGMGAPVIFIGSTLNVEEWDTDFRLNLPNAVKVGTMGATDVNAPSFGEVGVLFDDSLLRAVATINRGTRSNNPMISPRIPKLGDVGWTIKLESISKPRHPSQLNYSYYTNTNIAYFDLVSETHLSTFDQLVDDKFIQGIVIGAFGAGNVPSKMIPSIYRAVYEKGKAVGVITNNKKGSSDMGLYDVGAAAVKAGAISLGPMTKPAAIEKMRYAVANAQGDDKIEFLQDVARILLTSVAEEIPESFSRHAVNQFTDRFRKTPAPLDSFYKEKPLVAPQYEVKTYCKSSHSDHKILVISMGGTFYMEVNAEGALSPTKRPLGDLLDLKFKGLDRLVSLDYIELYNLDSSDVEHFHRAQLSKVIAKHLGEYDGFVVLHGTDTLAYTASAISYMLTGIGKDVILTGAQKPGYGSSDFDRNFIKAIKAILARLMLPKAAQPAPGVKVAFGDKLMIGTTVIKEDEHGINAFAPVEKHPLAGKLNMIIDLFNVTGHVKKRDFSLFTDFSQEVAYFECINGIDIKQFEQVVENPEVHAILIGGYDTGNMPLNMKYYIATAVNSYHKPVVFISHSDNGVVEMSTEGRVGEFIKAGAIGLGDMIKESAYQKLCFAMGLARKQDGLDPREKMEFVRKIMHTNFAGEISDRFCTEGDKTYKGLFCERTFSDQDIEKAIDKETAQPPEPKPAIVVVREKDDLSLVKKSQPLPKGKDTLEF